MRFHLAMGVAAVALFSVPAFAQTPPPAEAPPAAAAPAAPPPAAKSWKDLITVEGLADAYGSFRPGGSATVPVTPKAASFGPMNDFFLDILERKRSDPGQDLLSVLVRAELDGKSINDANVLMLATATLVAGNETTRTLLGWLAWVFATYPDQFQLLRKDPGLASAAVEECLRIAPPVQGFLRTATQDTEVRGVPINAGDHLFMMYLSANRDEDIFPDPDPNAFDIQRKVESGHIAFGWGQHLCVGAALARLEGRIFAEELAARFSELQIARPPTRIRSVLQNGFVELPMAFVP